MVINSVLKPGEASFWLPLSVKPDSEWPGTWPYFCVCSQKTARLFSWTAKISPSSRLCSIGCSPFNGFKSSSWHFFFNVITKDVNAAQFLVKRKPSHHVTWSHVSPPCFLWETCPRINCFNNGQNDWPVGPKGLTTIKMRILYVNNLCWAVLMFLLFLYIRIHALTVVNFFINQVTH